jgi:hypothetical protein
MPKKYRAFLLLSVLIFTSANPQPERSREIIDIVYCLDLSASTNGLIDDVRERIWDVVNHVNSFRPAPHFRIGVVGYARPSFGEKNYYVEVLSDLTTDFDLLAFKLNKLRSGVEKGDHFVGMALQTAIDNMNWTKGNGPIKIIYVVGNGRVDMGGSNHFRNACEDALKEGITIHSIYCRMKKNEMKDVAGWREIARLTKGDQFDIKIHKRAPQVLVSEEQQELYHLSEGLNKTYVYHGKNGAARYRMMTSVDEHALKSSPMDFQSRLFYKISDHYQYHQQSWDLVDYLKSAKVGFDKIDPEYLPDSLRSSTPDDLYGLALKLKGERNIIIKRLRNHLPYNRQSVIDKVYMDDDIYQADIFDRIVVRSLDKMALTGGYNTGNTR